jgi:vacuolar-type H+-ATPase subunit I/STV1
MRASKPVAVSSGAFLFCKYTVAVMFWAALLFRWKWMVGLCFVILVLNAALKIQKAPLIVLYTQTINRIFKSYNNILDEYAMQFAHTLGAVLTLLCLVFLYYGNVKIGWILVFIVAIVKTAGAMGFCSALKLYGCMTSDSCCRFIKGKTNG